MRGKSPLVTEYDRWEAFWTEEIACAKALRHEAGGLLAQQLRGWREGQAKAWSCYHTEQRSRAFSRREWGASGVLTEETHLEFCFRKINLGELEDGVGGKETR